MAVSVPTSGARLAVLAAAAMLATPATATPPAPVVRLKQALGAVVAAGAPGAILLARDGGRTVRLASGFGDAAAKTPMRPTDRFRIGSVTKTFVATVVLQLVAEGKLKLDDTVAHRLSGGVPGGDRITVRRLLGQTTGLSDYLADPRIFAPYLHGKLGYVWTPQKLLAVARSHKPGFAPGKRWEYSNTNYLLLGLIVEAATGHSLGNELQKRIFTPLGLFSTSFDSQPLIAGPHSHGYTGSGAQRQDVTDVSPTAAWAAGAIVSTADDVARFYRALLGGQLLRPELLRAMETTVPMGTPGDRYGFGLWRSTTLRLSAAPLPCGEAWGHNGSWLGYFTNAFNSRDGKRQIVLLVNVDEQALTPRLVGALARVASLAYCGR